MSQFWGGQTYFLVLVFNIWAGQLYKMGNIMGLWTTSGVSLSQPTIRWSCWPRFSFKVGFPGCFGWGRGVIWGQESRSGWFGLARLLHLKHRPSYLSYENWILGCIINCRAFPRSSLSPRCVCWLCCVLQSPPLNGVGCQVATGLYYHQYHFCNTHTTVTRYQFSHIILIG